MFGAEKLFGAVNRQLLGDIHVFTTAIPAFARIAFGVFVREHRALRLQDRRTGEVFAGYQFDVLLLPLSLRTDRLGDLRVNFSQPKHPRSFDALHLGHPTRVTSAFEMRVEKSVHHLLRLLRADEFAAETKHIGVIVLPGQRRHFFVENQRRTGARHFVGRDAHPEAGGANQKPKVAFLIGHVVRHGLREIRIVGRVHRGGAEVQDLQAPLFQMLPERLLQLVAGVVSAERHGNRPVRGRAGGGAAGSLVDEFQYRSDPLFDLVAAIEINFIRTPNGVGNVLLKNVQRFIKFAEQESLLGRVGVEQVDRIDVPVRHAENVIGLVHHIRGEHAAALLRDVNAQFPQGLHRIRAGRLAFNRPHPRRKHAEVPATFGGVPEKALRHGAATNVPGANEKNGSHARNNDFNLGRAREMSTAKSAWKRPFHDRDALQQIESPCQRRIPHELLRRILSLFERRRCHILIVRTQTFTLHPDQFGLVETMTRRPVCRTGLRSIVRHSQLGGRPGKDFVCIGKIRRFIFAADGDLYVRRDSRGGQRFAFANADLAGGNAQPLAVEWVPGPSRHQALRVTGRALLDGAPVRFTLLQWRCIAKGMNFPSSWRFLL